MGKDRPWLAEQIGISLGTLYNQFSHGFTKRSKERLAELMTPKKTGQEIELSFTDREFDTILEAMRLTGYTSRRDFYHDSITERAETIIADEAKTLTPIVTFPVQSSMRVAEDTQAANGTEGSTSSPPPVDYSKALKGKKKR